MTYLSILNSAYPYNQYEIKIIKVYTVFTINEIKTVSRYGGCAVIRAADYFCANTKQTVGTINQIYRAVAK